jgi:hypothetical protein
MKRLTILLLALGLLMTGCGRIETNKTFEQAAGPSHDLIAWSWDHISTQLAEPYDRVFVQFDRKELGPVDEYEEAGIHIAYIDGDVYWTAQEALDCVDAVSKSSVRTLAIDAEWYNSDGAVDTSQYLDLVTKAYSRATSLGIRLCLCIPYWLDTVYGEETLRTIIENCDELIVMDYYCSTAVENVRTEVELCRECNKVCQVALEISDPAREEGLEETATYWNLGLSVLEKDIEALKAAYPDIGITIHQAKYLDEFYSK